MKLRRNEFCAIHHSLFCCGREKTRKERKRQRKHTVDKSSPQPVSN